MGRTKRTWKEVLIIDLKECKLSEDLALDRSKWRNKIHIVDPNTVGIKALMMMMMMMMLRKTIAVMLNKSGFSQISVNGNAFHSRNNNA